ncbi:MAG: hypothetical protein D6808_03390 [Candidatus Dadabacteria bacterium]|nr:MAG: hypothetical protein D6808_03390 [Candidatus Dadabacteria bacterium]
MRNSAEYTLGISAYYHDSAAAILKDGVPVAAAQEERFTRKKHDHSFPENAIKFCLDKAGIRPESLSSVAFYDKPWLKFERLLDTYLAFAPVGFSSFVKAMPLWLKQKLWIGDLVKKRIGYDGEIVYPLHHESHAASAFFPSPFAKAAIITVDGVGEWSTCSWGIGDGNRIELKSEIRFPHSLGLLYSAFTYYTGFKVNSGEYKVMGLAPYGEPRYADKILEELIDIREDGSFWLNMDYFNYCQGLTMTSEKFHALFGGPPRKPESRITQREMDLAASVQKVTEEVMKKIAAHVRRETGMDNLCLAGGVALNCVANGLLIKEKIFKDIWVQPAAGDAGGALGAAYVAYYMASKEERPPRKQENFNPYLGPAFSNEEITSWLDKKGYPYSFIPDESLYKVCADELASGKVLGWFTGRMEFGPRALGARSILGDPRDAKMQKTINLKIKFRESFRPFAPAVLEEDMKEYFDFDRPSPYMLFTAPVADKARKELPPEYASLTGLDKLKVERSVIPAVTHVDYSARIQTVDGVYNKRFYRLLRAFKEASGCSVLVNTSFNIRGEPIVCTPEDAYRCFMATEMDTLVLENCLLKKEKQPNKREDFRYEVNPD